MAPKKYETIAVRRYQDGTASLCLSRPRIYNAVNLKMLEEIIDALQSLDEDDAVRSIVLCSEGKHFCAGLDFSSFKEVSASLADPSICPGQARAKLFKTIQHMQAACTAFESCSKPVVAAVHGICLGAGVDMITACDIRVCAPKASFSVTEVDVAITADMGTLQRLPRIIGDARARELALTARAVPAEEALTYGLVTSIAEAIPHQGQGGLATPDGACVWHHAHEIARTLAAKPAGALAGTKRVMLWGRGRPVEEGLRDVALLNSAILYSHDFQKALARGPKKTASKLWVAEPATHGVRPTVFRTLPAMAYLDPAVYQLLSTIANRL